MNPPPKRRWHRISLCIMLAIVTMLCMLLGWKVQQVERQRKAVAWVRQVGGRVWYDYQANDSGLEVPTEVPSRRWGFISDDYSATIVGVDLDETDVSDISPLIELRDLRQLRLYDTPIRDLTPIAAMTDMRELYLSGTKITDLSPLMELTNLEGLYLSETKIDDVSPLKNMKFLSSLELNNTRIRDLMPLSSLTGLKHLDLSGTATETDVRRLRKALPACDITR